MTALLFLRLSELVDGGYLVPAEADLGSLAPSAAEDGLALGQTVCVLDRLVRGATEIVIVGDVGSPLAKELGDAVFAAYLPNRVVATIDPSRPESQRAASLLAEGKPAPAAGSVVAYVCRNRSCSAPVTTKVDLERLLRNP